MDQILLQNQPQYQRICQKMKKLLIKKQQLSHDQPTLITDGIYLGNYSYAINKKYLAENRITLVISCLKIQDRDRCQGVQYREVLVRDQVDENISQYLEGVAEMIRLHVQQPDGDRKCLVNCFSGKSRSPTLVIGFLIRAKRMSFDDAINMVKSKCPYIDPNPGFIKQLKQYQIAIQAQSQPLQPQTILEQPIQQPIAPNIPQQQQITQIAQVNQPEITQQESKQQADHEIPNPDHRQKQLKLEQGDQAVEQKQQKVEFVPEPEQATSGECPVVINQPQGEQKVEERRVEIEEEYVVMEKITHKQDAEENMQVLQQQKAQNQPTNQAQSPENLNQGLIEIKQQTNQQPPHKQQQSQHPPQQQPQAQPEVQPQASSQTPEIPPPQTDQKHEHPKPQQQNPQKQQPQQSHQPQQHAEQPQLTTESNDITNDQGQIRKKKKKHKKKK